MLFTLQQRAIFANYIAAVLEISLVGKAVAGKGRRRRNGRREGKLLFITTEQEKQKEKEKERDTNNKLS